MNVKKAEVSLNQLVANVCETSKSMQNHNPYLIQSPLVPLYFYMF